jgi:hypothetical protein
MMGRLLWAMGGQVPDSVTFKSKDHVQASGSDWWRKSQQSFQQLVKHINGADEEPKLLTKPTRTIREGANTLLVLKFVHPWFHCNLKICSSFATVLMFVAGGLRLEVSVESANNNQTTLVEGFYLSARMSKEFPEPMLEKNLESEQLVSLEIRSTVEWC